MQRKLYISFVDIKTVINCLIAIPDKNCPRLVTDLLKVNTLYVHIVYMPILILSTRVDVNIWLCASKLLKETVNLKVNTYNNEYVVSKRHYKHNYIKTVHHNYVHCQQSSDRPKPIKGWELRFFWLLVSTLKCVLHVPL